jgi:hypothetical protein
LLPLLQNKASIILMNESCSYYFKKRKTSIDDRRSHQKTHHFNRKGVRSVESAKGACQPEARSIEDFSDRGIVNEDRDFPYCFLLTNSNGSAFLLSTLLISAIKQRST